MMVQLQTAKPPSLPRAYDAVRVWAGVHGILVGEEALPPGNAGQFDGVTVTLNRDYDLTERLYYLVHALGSIVLWSMDTSAVQAMFDELRDAKAEQQAQHRLDNAITRFRNFETESSQLAVWLLMELGYPELVASYSNFMRADLESITIFHRTGQAPVWQTFFASWNEEQAAGSRQVIPFPAQPIPHFLVHQIEKQEILQQQAEQG